MKKIKLKTIFGISFFFLLVSRILILTDNYALPIDPIILQILYILFLVMILVVNSNRKVNLKSFKSKDYIKVISILLIHTFLWGNVFVNQAMVDLTNSQFKSQIMFLVIIILTSYVVIKLDSIDVFIKASFYAISFVLIIQLILNFSELNLSNIKNIMNKDERYRANFGFGHYNTLGGACLCNIILWSLLNKFNHNKIVPFTFFIVSIIMLLCSASRSSITALIFYFVILGFEKISNNKMSSKKKTLVCIIKIFIFFILLIFSLNIDFEELLLESQRSLLFEKSIPEFLGSGRILEGLGYVSNTAYGTNLTPYTTYWLDNGYIYLLVSTGVLGFLLIFYVIILLIRTFYFTKNLFLKNNIYPILLVYLYTSIFEANLFNSGSINNYVYLVIFLYYIYKINYNKNIIINN